MSQTVKKFSVTYDAINDSNTFTNGDINCCKMLCDHTYVVLLKTEEGQPYCHVIAPGTHVYPFTFQFPPTIFPASIKVLHGYVQYFLEAKLSRSMKIPNKAATELRYMPKPDLTIPGLMTPQHGMTDKKMKLFTSGNVSFSMQTERMGYYLGENIKIILEVQNSSSRTLKTKYSLNEKLTYHAMGRRDVGFHVIQKEEGEPIPPSTKQTLTKVLTIPPSANVSIFNCKVLKVEHHLKVYLDVPYATDPEIVVPIVILPILPTRDLSAPPQPNTGFEGYSNPGQAGWGNTPYTAPPPAYESYGAYPPYPPYPN
ncbi:arrestin domain-containing protein 3-like [Sardina pilchardus]|uniref:arrestin domain-containing protein 3-like n=1 Tax=Sardina pilchardus TaxID=27697 RepID=UPI002E0FB941